MNERLLQFIWQHQYFNKNELTTVQGEQVQIIKHGHYNSNQGPDFSEAILKIGNTTWAGNIELHVHTSDWKKHEHDNDKNYDNVILHVVWKHDENVNNTPVLELNSLIPKVLLKKYEQIMHAPTFIPCENHIAEVNPLVWTAWKERLVIERLARKSLITVHYLQQNNYHWEETFWWLLARNFGMKVNGDAFEQMARSLPLQILSKHKNQIIQLEALIFGQAGLLSSKFTDAYPKMLQREYQFYKNKYRLGPGAGGAFFLRMRPVNFPTVRLAQLAMLVHESVHLFSKIKEIDSIKTVKECMKVTANDYWHYHYRFDEDSVFMKKQLGQDMIDHIIINTVVPVLFCYGRYHNDQKIVTKALRWLDEIPAESNVIIQGYKTLKLSVKSAFSSQALIELKTQYCDARKCLYCAIGNAVLKDSAI